MHGSFRHISALLLLLTCGCRNEHGGHGRQEVQLFSWSVAESKKRGTFVCEAEVMPNALSFAENKITFEAAWLERQPDGQFALCIRVDKGKDVFKQVESPFLVRGDRQQGFNERHGRGWLQFIEQLDSDDLSAVRASMIQNWKEERKKDICFRCKEN